MRVARLAVLSAVVCALASAGGALGQPISETEEPVAAAPAAADPETLEVARRAAPPAVAYVIVDGAGVAEPLTSASPPDPERGRQVFESPERGDCLSCHRLGDLGGGPGPALDGVGVRLTIGALRLWVVNPAALKDVPGKPAYYSVFDPPPGAPTPQTRLTAQEVEDLVAFLAAQR